MLRPGDMPFDPEPNESEWRARALGIRLSWSTRIRMGRAAPPIDRLLAEIEEERDRQEAARLGVAPRPLSGGRTSAVKHGVAAGVLERQRRAVRAATIYRRMLARQNLSHRMARNAMEATGATPDTSGNRPTD